jgi:DNA-binding response OmpR family regulator
MLHVLVLEDDPIIAMDIKSIVDEMSGFAAFTASDMPSALKVASKNHINIIVSDIQIKGDTDGIETTKRLQEIYNLQVIFLTSFSDDATLQRASNVNFSGYIIKPFREKELVAALKLCAMKIAGESYMVDIGNGYSYDKKRQLLFLDGDHIALTTKEQQLFLILLHSRGRLVPFSYIDEVIWMDEVVSDTTRRQLFHRLRGKLQRLIFVAVKSAGYKMES